MRRRSVSRVGFYDGILGPGTGSFFVILIVSVLGYGFLQASVNAKIANLTTNLAALAVYGVHGEILLVLGLAMAAMNITGGFIGAHMATRRGSGFVRIVFLVTLSILIVKLAWDTRGAVHVVDGAGQLTMSATFSGSDATSRRSALSRATPCFVVSTRRSNSS